AHAPEAVDGQGHLHEEHHAVVHHEPGCARRHRGVHRQDGGLKPMLRAEKQKNLEQIRQRFDKMSSAVFVDFTGLDVPTVTKLRDRLRAASVEYKVVKNT